ncbi:MAG: hypothetical protein ACFB0Z_06900 [Candidatus Phaeomarinobacter sp.]
MNELKERFREPSTYAGLAAITVGLGQVLDWDEAGQVAGLVQGAGEQISTGNWVGAAVAVLLGGAAMWKREGR